MRIRKINLSLILLFLLIVGCATAPITGRKQLMMMSKAEEEKMGEGVFYYFIKPLWDRGQIIKPDDPRPDMREHSLKVSRILGRIMGVTGWDKEYKWKYVIVEDPKTINAAMCPGGKLIVYTGILNFAKSDDELAGIIGHEVGHAMARHGAERYSQIMAANLTLAAIDVAVASSQKSSKYGQAIHVAFGLGAQLGVLLPYSRAHENEADYIGFLIMAKAGYDPTSTIEFWERMERESQRTQIEFLSTHPSYGTRISNLRQWLPQAIAYRQDPTMPLPTKGEQVQASVRKPAAEFESKSATQLSFEGLRLFEQGKYYEAITYFKKAIEKNSQYDEAYFRMGLCYGRLDRYQEAMEAFKEVTRIRPSFAEAHHNLGLAYGKRGRNQEAMEAFKEATRLKPDYADAHGNLGIAYGQLGRYQEAIEAFRQFIRINPNDAKAYFNLAVAYGKVGRFHEAIEALNQVIRIDPNNAKAYGNRGYAYFEVGNDQSALQDFQKAIELDKNKANSYVGLSMIYFRRGKIEEAKNYYKKAIEIEPSWKLGPDALEKEKRYWFTPKEKQTINQILSCL